MARDDQEPGMTPSLLDRLTDPESGGTGWRRGYGIEAMVNAVRRDVEDLLNSHRTDVDLPDEFVEVRKSIVSFGLPDLVSYNAVDAQVGQRVGRMIEESIARHEPRLKDVRATPIPGDAGQRANLQFHIGAKLAVDPSPDVSFVTVLKLTTGQASVRSGEE